MGTGGGFGKRDPGALIAGVHALSYGDIVGAFWDTVLGFDGIV